MWTTGLEPFVQTYGLWGLFADIFLESMGLPMPGETLLVIAAGLASTGALNIVSVAVTAFVAAVLGDNLGFLIGRRLGRQVVLRHGARIGITQARLQRVEQVLDSKGAIIVVVARFIVLLRQLNGLAAGTAGMHWLRFVIANAIGAALWVGAWASLAYFFGKKADMLPTLWHMLSRFAFLLVPMLILALVAAWLWRRARGRTAGTEPRD